MSRFLASTIFIILFQTSYAQEINIKRILQKAYGISKEGYPLNGTTISLVHPKQFQLDKNINRFTFGNNFIQLNEISSKPFNVLMTDIFTKVNQGISARKLNKPILRSVFRLVSANDSAFVIVLPDQIEKRTIIYGFGNSTASALFTSTYKDKDDSLQENILTTLFSARRSRNFFLDSFSFDFGNEYFQLEKSSRPYYYFSHNLIPNGSNRFSNAALLVYPIETTKKITEKDFIRFESRSLQLLSGNSIKIVDRRNDKKFLPNPLNSYYSEISGIVNDTSLIVNFAIFSTSDEYIVVIGRSEKFDKVGQDEIKKILNSIRKRSR